MICMQICLPGAWATLSLVAQKVMASARRAAANLRNRLPGAENGAVLRLTNARAGRLRADDMRAVHAQVSAAAQSHTVHSALLEVGALGSDHRQLLRAGETGASRAAATSEHFQSIADVLRLVGEAPLPVVAILDGPVSGPSVGIGAHASACVVTERTRASLPGVAHGFVPESFASYALARLPPGLGAYLALTGAQLTGQEMVDVGLATHATESTATRHIASALAEQRARSTGRTLSALEDHCFPPRRVEYGPAHALHHLEFISECFSPTSLGEIQSALAAGGTEWHAQAAHAVASASPLAASLALELLRDASGCERWALCLQREAELCAAATASDDYRSGADALEALKRQAEREARAAAAEDWRDDDEDAADEDGAPRDGDGGGRSWEHADAAEVTEAVIREYWPHARPE